MLSLLRRIPQFACKLFFSNSEKFRKGNIYGYHFYVWTDIYELLTIKNCTVIFKNSTILVKESDPQCSA